MSANLRRLADELRAIVRQADINGGVIEVYPGDLLRIAKRLESASILNVTKREYQDVLAALSYAFRDRSLRADAIIGTLTPDERADRRDAVADATRFAKLRAKLENAHAPGSERAR